jgi:hypothetical protein
MSEQSKYNVDFRDFPKQEEYFFTSMAAAQGVNPYKILSYGGAARGGKTFGTLVVLLRLCEVFPGSRWHAIRKDFPSLQKTTIPTFEKIVRGSKNWNFNRSSSNYYACNKKGSKIFFMSENISRDPFLNSFLGLETNGIFLEQAEELSEKLWEKSLERTGSWYIPKMPRGLIFLTFNPTQTWVKDKIYMPFIEGNLPPEYFFMQAFPKDNPFVTEDQYESWNMMAERYRKQFVEGDWTDFDGQDGRWLFAFKEKQNVGRVEWNPDEYTYLSFDFNINPITCGVFQHHDGIIRCVRVIQINDATTIQLCKQIEEEFPNAFFFVTGDASGENRTTVSRLNNFKVIKNYFNLSQSQMKLSRSNPHLKDSRLFCNSVIETVPFIVDEDNAKALIFDFKNCKANTDNTIVKDNRKKAEQKADVLDMFRYYLHAFFKDFVRLVES